jgi:hypothetical protein
LFGPLINKNGYRYTHSEDEEFIARVERNWMITHQKSKLPNSRLINKAEARGYVVENKGVKVNWCVLAEWTVRDQLRRIQALGDTSKGVECVDLNSEDREGEDLEEEEDTTVMGRRTSHPGSKGIVVNEGCVSEWLEHISVVEKELLALESVLSPLEKAKVDANLELAKISGQLEDRHKLVDSANIKFTDLKVELDAQNLALLNLRSSGSTSEEIGVALVTLESLQRKIDAQTGILDAFQGLLDMGEADHKKAFEKASIAESECSLATKKFNVWKHQKKVFLLKFLL